MAVQFTKSEQINSCMQMVMDYDQKFTKRAEFLHALQKALGNDVTLIKYQGTKDVYLYRCSGVDHYIICASVTYLGNPHPLFKKRMQLKKWYKDFYHEYKNKPNATINLIGIYHYDGVDVYCDFNLSDYIGRKLNSSSAHVYINDIYQAMKEGSFDKVDINGNRITVIKWQYLKNFFAGIKTDNPVVKLFESFNSQFSFDQWLRADACIKTMLDNHWYQAKGTEWAGWFLEFKVDDFIQKENCSSIMQYTGNKNKAAGMLDFDLFFGTLNFYGDLKASDIGKKEAPGNDQGSTLEAISKHGRLWYIIYEHETIKDKTLGNEMAIKRMQLLNENFKIGDPVSYTSRMKHSVRFKRMQIFELNAVNMHSILSDFNQGHNSGASMAARMAKFLLDKNNMNNSIIYTYEV